MPDTPSRELARIPASTQRLGCLGHRLGNHLTEAQIQSTPKRSHALQEGYRNLDEGADIEGDPVWIREGGFSEELDCLVQFFAVGESGTKKKKGGSDLLRIQVEMWVEGGRGIYSCLMQSPRIGSLGSSFDNIPSRTPVYLM